MRNTQQDILVDKAVELLKKLISIPSLSRQEDKTADAIAGFLENESIDPGRLHNNIYAVNKFYNPALPSVLLNSHHDTVAANSQYTIDPYLPIEKDGKLYGLGSTDAGASLVSLLATFLFFYDRDDLPFNLVFAASAEEEISGTNGIESLIKDETFSSLFSKGSFAIVGEPTQLQLAIAEKGLMVLDCVVTGIAGHAAREEGENAIYKALEDLSWFRDYRFPKKSEWLGEVKMTVTSIEISNKAHNIIPASCNFTVDVRVTDAYTMEEVLETIRKNVQAEIKARSMRLKSTIIDPGHPLVKAGIELGKQTFGSPTMSDKALIPFPALKCGPGNSAQSHTADEFILLDDIKEGIDFYIELMTLLIEKNRL